MRHNAGMSATHRSGNWSLGGLQMAWRVLPAWTQLLLTMITGLLLLRTVFVLHSGYAHALGWSLLADLAAAIVLLPAAPWVLRRAIAVPLLAVPVALAYMAAAEHAAIHGSLFRVAHIAQAMDQDFLASTLAPSMLLSFPIYAALAGGWLYLLHRQVRAEGMPRMGRVATTAVSLGLLALYFLNVPSITHPANNVLSASLAQMPGAAWHAMPRAHDAIPGARRANPDPAFFIRDDSGQVTTQRPNILLIMVEGLSGAYLPSIAEHQGLAPELQLPELDRLLEDFGFAVYPNMLAMQRQTNRGTYPLLCGDYAKIVSGVPKMTVIATGGQPIDCAPSVLRRSGYHTLYLQAASLSFMNKDQFMPLAGFGESIGRAELEAEGVESGPWGAADPAFFDAVARHAQRLSDEGRAPWFATVLNVGTHHPFIPADVSGVEELNLPTRRQKSFDEMVVSLSGTLDRLARNGMLDDTLIIITSDEAGGFLEHGDRSLVLHNNFGFLAWRWPDRGDWPELADTRRIVSQMDIPVTLLDMTGNTAEGNMVGRSLLAGSSDQPRGILFGDTYMARSYFLRDSGSLVGCDETLLRCEHWHFDPDRLFGTLERADVEVPLALAQRQRLTEAASLVRDLGIASQASYRMAPGTVSAERPYRGGQGLPLGAEDVLEVRLEAQLLPSQGGDAQSGTVWVELRDLRRDEIVTRREVRVEGELSMQTQLRFASEDAPIVASIDLNWSPDEEGSYLAVRDLELEIREDALADYR